MKMRDFQTVPACSTTALRSAVWFLFVSCSAAAVHGQDAVSFTKQIAPMLSTKCGGCHVTGRRGGFQMVSYEGLMKSGHVQKGVGESSRIYEVIESGDMPRGGAKVTPDQLAMLKKWIDAGAAFDGPDPAAPLAGGMAGPRAPSQGMRKAEPLKPGDVSFAFDVAPLLIQHCTKCHDNNRPEEGLRLTSLQGVLQGGQSGPSIITGNSAESLLVRKIRGRDIDGQRMPRGSPPLPDESIALIAKWIDQGAKLDLLTWTDDVEDVAAAGRARSLSDAELGEVRSKAGAVMWRLAIPDEDAVVEPRGRVRVIGNLPPERMTALADTAAEIEKKVHAELGAGEAPLVKGGTVLYLFRNAYDFSAFWQQVMRGERPKGVTGHAGSRGDVVYGAVLVPSSTAEAASTELLLAEQIAGAALVGRGLPRWFAQGAARAIAQRVVPKAKLSADWKREIPSAVREIGSTKDFFSIHAEPAALLLASGGFVGALASPSSKLRQFIARMAEGGDFDAAFAAVFRGKPEQLFEAWAVKEAKKK